MMLPELGVILDAGTGIFRARDLIQTKTLDIFLSHAHLDHVIGLTFLFDVLCNKEMERVTVHCQQDKAEAIQTHLYSNLLFPVPPNFEFHHLNGDPVELLDGSTLHSIEMNHPGGSLGFRIDWPDRKLAYITDTTASNVAPYVEFIRGVDTLVHECYFPDGWEDKAELTGHSCLTPVAEVSRLACAGRTFLVHINPLDESDNPLDLDSVKSIFDPIEVASDNQVIDI